MKRTSFIILLLLGITVLCTHQFDNSPPLQKETIKESKFDLKQSEKQVAQVDMEYHSSMQRLKESNDSLLLKISFANIKLESVKQKLYLQKEALQRLLQKDTTELTVNEKLSDCDTIKEKVGELMTTVERQNNLFDLKTGELNELIANKDSQLVLCDNGYKQLRDIMEENFRREKYLTEQLETAYKQQRRKRFQSKALTAGIIILSGVTSAFYINAKQ